MANWTWKQFVADDVLDAVNTNGSHQFCLNDLYLRELVYQQRFPNNKHIREKIRQSLQQLRDIDFLKFLGNGRYELNLEFEEFELTQIVRETHQSEVPGTKSVKRIVRLRNTLLVADMKRRYENRCQICQETVDVFNRKYSEGHHIQPMGTPHLGQDTVENILVLCPNHHVMIDRGALSISPQTLIVEHLGGAFTPRRLQLGDWHVVDMNSIQYYKDHIMQKNMI